MGHSGIIDKLHPEKATTNDTLHKRFSFASRAKRRQ